ncbi:hypothetical protein RFI_02815 [Reticulomyxa filosa]|uniref:Uncharacterized protein n=1 Tax=Reticulomyxa filosa TaxID=46433 RepID=X6P839_RETFI|nr:hypothetical protein RFI_02815 [Reticulomyxa filosa]|eukprot:ETO34278.1 hypothetical protein RFI_02815 [Reticulomyxa filosa]
MKEIFSDKTNNNSYINIDCILRLTCNYRIISCKAVIKKDCYSNKIVLIIDIKELYYLIVKVKTLYIGNPKKKIIFKDKICEILSINKMSETFENEDFGGLLHENDELADIRAILDDEWRQVLFYQMLGDLLNEQIENEVVEQSIEQKSEQKSEQKFEVDPNMALDIGSDEEVDMGKLNEAIERNTGDQREQVKKKKRKRIH